MRIRIGSWFVRLGVWIAGTAEVVRDIAGAVAHARQHPTDLQDR